MQEKQKNKVYSPLTLKIIGVYWWLKKYKIDFILKNTKGLTSGLDLGCGTGSILMELNKNGKKVIGIDAVVEKETELIKKMDATCLDFPDKSFDFVICIGSLHHFEDKQKAINEMKRVARYKVLINDINYYGNFPLRFLVKYIITPINKVDKDVKEYIWPSKNAIFNNIRTHFWEIYERGKDF